MVAGAFFGAGLLGALPLCPACLGIFSLLDGDDLGLSTSFNMESIINESWKILCMGTWPKFPGPLVSKLCLSPPSDSWTILSVWAIMLAEQSAMPTVITNVFMNSKIYKTHYRAVNETFKRM
jgi:hypothetical protein